MQNLILFTGGYSGERVISLQTAATFRKHLDEKKYRIFTVEVSRGNWICTFEGKDAYINWGQFNIEFESKTYKPDVALIALHGPPGENGWLQGLLQVFQIPFTTGDTLCMSLTFNKKLSIDIAARHGIPTAKSVLFKKDNVPNLDTLIKDLGLPLFVKPNTSGSSLGISKVLGAQDLPAAIELAFTEGDEIMVESFLSGIEVTCGVYRQKGLLIALPPTEIRSHNSFFDFAAKYHKASDEITPAEIPDEWILNVQNTAKKVYESFQCKGVARVDFMVNEKGIPYLIEINTVPGMSGESIVPQQLRAANIPFSEFLDDIINEALAH